MVRHTHYDSSDKMLVVCNSAQILLGRMSESSCSAHTRRPERLLLEAAPNYNFFIGNKMLPARPLVRRKGCFFDQGLTAYNTLSTMHNSKTLYQAFYIDGVFLL